MSESHQIVRFIVTERDRRRARLVAAALPFAAGATLAAIIAAFLFTRIHP